MLMGEDHYRKGYFHALLDIATWVDNNDDLLESYRTKKLEVVRAVLGCVIRDDTVRDEFRSTRGVAPNFTVDQRGSRPNVMFIAKRK